ncbi:unnamed protein product [Larinioides sclopetarius]|uniref:Uncharacterized protein n=1 Tax=Larinioides sclopetarius TaxID=280406 RepID=A0AAV1ZMC9_9ARAC
MIVGKDHVFPNDTEAILVTCAGSSEVLTSLCECGVLSLVSHALFTEDSGQTVGTPSVTLSLCLTWEVFVLRSFLLQNNHRERKALSDFSH